ncbi:type IV toxin-antitoxin system AbiEi family antitoxin domain-containing protein [Luteococcus sp. Sow4_B9]|uniref:type IV toxin-antitoxin system AbiEi family antitoxin domain-containing protein n=1 Tax=Luteococcus sp. Sow4_B9 TaxID=3438792 RepID=UPI003F9CEC61
MRRTLAEITGSQWGLVTSRQALARGVSHMQLSRLADTGDLVRLAHGVYRDGGTPSGELDELRAAWLSTKPTALAYERLAHHRSEVVVSLASAANLLEIGDFRPTKVSFTTAARRQTQKTDIRYRSRKLPDSDITIAGGLPVTTVERTIADLVETDEDLSTVSDAYRDASLRMTVNRDRLEELLAPLAQRNGLPKGDGAALLRRVEELAGLDIDSVAARVASAPELAARVLENLFPDLAAMRSVVPTPDLIGLLGQDVIAAMRPVVTPVRIPGLEQFAPALPVMTIPQNVLKDQQEATSKMLQPIREALASSIPAQVRKLEP